MNLTEINTLEQGLVAAELEKCCGSAEWVRCMIAYRPFADEDSLLKAAAACWAECTQADALEAFGHHPKIGSTGDLGKKFASTAEWASGEQAAVRQAQETVLEELAGGNVLYEQKFGYIFIVCATGKSAEEMLEMLRSRLQNGAEREMEIAMAEQRKITIIRLKKLLSL